MIEHWTAQQAAEWLSAPGPADDKYRRGVLGVRTGSSRYPGAAVLGVSAAWRVGAGLIRYVPMRDDVPSDSGLPTPAAAVLARHPETVFGAGGRECDAWLVGSGTDPTERSTAERRDLLSLLDGAAPVVVDAGALELALTTEQRGRAPRILTPHLGEFTRLWQQAGLGDPPSPWPDRIERRATPAVDDLARAALRLAERLEATILLKGSITIVATPGGRTISIGPATPWLATAGTGDVLAGILGALVAVHASEVRADPECLAALGATAALLHDLAARLAADDPYARGDGRPVTASDVIDAVPRARAQAISPGPSSPPLER